MLDKTEFFGGKCHGGALVIWSPRETRRSFGFVRTQAIFGLSPYATFYVPGVYVSYIERLK